MYIRTSQNNDLVWSAANHPAISRDNFSNFFLLHGQQQKYCHLGRLTVISVFAYFQLPLQEYLPTCVQ